MIFRDQDGVYHELAPAPFAGFEVRITPLILGVPGVEEKAGGVTSIAEEDTTLLPQFSALRVEAIVNDGRIGSVRISMHEPLLATLDLKPYQQALWIGYWRPGEYLAEAIFWGQCNVSDFYGGGYILLSGQDPYAGKARSHYIRRADPALNIDPERGHLPSHAFATEKILDAARNTPVQQNRNMPALALAESYMDFFTTPTYNEDATPADVAAGDAALIEFERGQEVVDLHQRIVDSRPGPDIDCVPPFNWPADRYANLNLYRPPVAAGHPNQLGRNLVPVDPDDPADDEVVFSYGFPPTDEFPNRLDNAVDVDREPGKPITHVHYLDASRRYRVTVADAASSQLIGAWVSFNVADFTITRPSRGVPADLTALRELAEAIVKSYGVPPGHMRVKLRKPDAPGMLQFGHPDWVAAVEGVGIEKIGGRWYLGDYVLVRADRGERSFSEVGRITKVILSQAGSNDLPDTEIELVPAVGGTAGEDLDYLDVDEAPTPASSGGGEGATPGEGSPTVGGGGSTGLVLPSGEPMPTTDLPGFRMLFNDDFDVDVPLGSFPDDVSDDFTAYPSSYQDTAKHGWYDPHRVLSVHDGMLDAWIHTELVGAEMRHLVAAPIPRLPADDPAVYSWTTSNGQSRSAQLYGRYAVRFRADDIDRYKIAWLLWPMSGSNLVRGEIDFPEGNLAAGSTIHGYMHRTNASSRGDQASVDTGETFTDWHTAEIEWTPGEIKYIFDGVEILDTTERIPDAPMIWVLQIETQLSDDRPIPLDSTEGHVYYDWLAAWAYDP